jgi:hypothetical protein
MVPCYIDMFYSQVSVATLELLEKLGIEADYPFDQTCCGQPMANSGAFTQAKATEELFVRNFAGYLFDPEEQALLRYTDLLTSRPENVEADDLDKLNAFFSEE